MYENTRLKLTCCIIGLLLWMIFAPMICLLCYNASPQNTNRPDLSKDWVRLFSQAQKKVGFIGAICGFILGYAASVMFEHKPRHYHVIVNQANCKKMFGLAPKTKAEAIVPIQVAVIGVAISIGIAVFILPRLGHTGILMVKPFPQTAALAAFEGAIISMPILPLSLKTVAKFNRREKQL